MSCFELYCSLPPVIMCSSKFGIFALLATLTVVPAVKLPTYMKQCKISDPNLNECIKDSAGPAVVKLLFGDESLNIPDVSKTPLQDQKYVIDGITYEIFQIQTDSSTDLTPVHVNMTFGTSPTFEITMHLSSYVWSGKFKATGTFLNKNIEEQGHINITFIDNKYKYIRILEEEDINGDVHYKVKDSYTTTSIGMTIYKPYDLASNGDKLSDDERQAFVNTLLKLQNSAEKYIGSICGDLVTFVLNAVFKVVPKKEIFAA